MLERVVVTFSGEGSSVKIEDSTAVMEPSAAGSSVKIEDSTAVMEPSAASDDSDSPRPKTEHSRSTLQLFLSVDIAGVGIGGDMWPAATLFSNVATSVSYRGFISSLFDGRRVLELGSGTGLCGILVDKAFSPTSVVITDQESHMPLIIGNMRRNSTSGACTAQTLDWTDAQTFPSAGSFDIILAMECVYHEKLYQPLIEAIAHCAHDDCLVFLGVTRQFAKPQFYAKLAAARFSYTLLPHEALPPSCSADTGGRDCGLFLLQRRRQRATGQ